MSTPPSARARGSLPRSATACGAVRVVADTVGTEDQARGEQNCLPVSHGEHQGIARAILRRMCEGELRERLEQGGRLPAANYRWERSLARFEQELLEVVRRRDDAGQAEPHKMSLTVR